MSTIGGPGHSECSFGNESGTVIFPKSYMKAVPKKRYLDAVLEVLPFRILHRSFSPGTKRRIAQKTCIPPGFQKRSTPNQSCPHFFRSRPSANPARYNGPGPLISGPRPVNFRCGLGGRQGPERRSTRSIVAFERYTARVLPATIAELCFQVFSDLISERSRSQISEAQKQILLQKCLMQTKCNSAMDE